VSVVVVGSDLLPCPRVRHNACLRCGQRVAHGTLIFSVGVGMTAGEVNPEAFSYGYDRLRFVKSVFIGDTISVRVSIKEKRDYSKNPNYGMIVEFVEVINQKGETVLVCEHLLLVRRKSAN
jgi:acyl dehydratase